MSESKSKSFSDIFLKKPVPFSDKRDVNWSAVRNLSVAMLILIVLGILLMPSKQQDIAFREGEKPRLEQTMPTSGPEQIPASAHGYRAAMGYPGAGGGSAKQRNGAMIISRDGLDSNSQLSPGSRVKVRLTQRVVVSNQAIPVIGEVTEDCVHEGDIAIPKGSKLFGDINFDSESKRGQLTWRSIQIGQGRVKQFEALSTALDGQAGIEGQVHSDAMKNSAGQALTRFIGAYAEGSMERTSFFGSPGGNANGLKNATAETAKYEAERMADRLKKEREWLELQPESEFYALLTQPFRFRDPGGIY